MPLTISRSSTGSSAIGAPGWDFPTESLAGVKATLGDEEGASHAIGYCRSIPRSLLVPGASALETWQIVFSGDRDGCIASEVYSGIEGAFTSPVRFEIVRGAGHFLPLEATDRVADLAIPFARS